MRSRTAMAGAFALLLPILTACQNDGGGVASAGSNAVSSAAKSVPSLVNVDLSNVLNDLAVRLNLDRANVPINAQIPVTLAVNVCGVSINVLSASAGGGKADCTATTSSPELAQVVQQQMAAGGSVGGGAQGGSTAGTSGSSASGAGTSGGAQGTDATSTGGSTAAPSSGTTQPQTTNPQ